MKLIIAITGASGVNLGLKFLKYLPNNIESFVVLSKNAKIAFKLENKQNYKDYIKDNKSLTLFKDKDITASIASGSFGANAMIVLPCSMNTLAKFSVGISDSLITRAFTVMLKERKK